MKTLLQNLIQLERQLVVLKILYQTNNDHLVAGLVLYTMRERKKADLTVFDNLFTLSFAGAIPILADLNKNNRFFVTW